MPSWSKNMDFLCGRHKKLTAHSKSEKIHAFIFIHGKNNFVFILYRCEAFEFLFEFAARNGNI